MFTKHETTKTSVKKIQRKLRNKRSILISFYFVIFTIYSTLKYKLWKRKTKLITCDNRIYYQQFNSLLWRAGHLDFRVEPGNYLWIILNKTYQARDKYFSSCKLWLIKRYSQTYAKTNTNIQNHPYCRFICHFLHFHPDRNYIG